MPKFGKRSLENLSTCHASLMAVCCRAIQIVDFTVIQGWRSNEEQDRLFHAGKSKVKAGFSKHNHTLPDGTPQSMAVDIVPWPFESHDVSVWNDPKRFCVLAGVMFAVAAAADIELRWGGDWDRDWDMRDQSFNDLPHFELHLS